MDLKLKDKTAVITGGTKGIGAGIAEVLAKEGCSLALIYRSDEAGARTFADRLASEYGCRVLTVKADVSDEASVENAYREILSFFPTVDILINNAAGGTKNVPFTEISLDDWNASMKGCLTPVLLMSKPFVKECREKKHEGRIVNVSAKAAFYSQSVNKIPYATAKGAIATMTQRMANDLISDGIYVNAIVPGYVLSNYYKDPESPQCKAKEKDLRIGWALPEDMGNITAFLCSPLSRQMIGVCVDCSGGTML